MKFIDIKTGLEIQPKKISSEELRALFPACAVGLRSDGIIFVDTTAIDAGTIIAAAIK